MRSFIRLSSILALIIFTFTPTANGMSPLTVDTEGVGNAAAEILKPLIQPLADEFVLEAAKKLKGALNILSKSSICENLCVTAQAATCRKLLSRNLGKARVSQCKEQCQQMIKVGGGYTLKIRFTEDTSQKKGWSLQNCVTTAKKTGLHEFNENNKFSIAIYGQEDYNLAMEIIGEIAALEKFILLDGHVPETKGKKPEQIKDLVAKAKLRVDALNKRFQEHAQTKFGPQ